MSTKGLAARAPEREKTELSLAELGARIQSARQAKNLTRPQLAVAVGIDPSTLYRIEKGTLSVGFEKLARIAVECGTTVAKLVKR